MSICDYCENQDQIGYCEQCGVNYISTDQFELKDDLKDDSETITITPEDLTACRERMDK